MRIRQGQCSHTGKVREHNEDALAVDETWGILVLADGMGGYQAGEVASEMAVRIVMEELLRYLPNFNDFVNNYQQAHIWQQVSVLLERAIYHANLQIFSAAEQNSHYRGMGTTIVAAVLSASFISIAHVGDSRLYRLRGQEFKPLTKDHSVRQELIDCGFYTPAQARYAPNKNLVTRALGVGETVEVSVQTQVVNANDIYLLCSDGLNDMLDDSEIYTALQRHPHDLILAANALVDAANNAGGEDNISVLLASPLVDINLFTPAPARSWWKKFWG